MKNQAFLRVTLKSTGQHVRFFFGNSTEAYRQACDLGLTEGYDWAYIIY